MNEILELKLMRIFLKFFLQFCMHLTVFAIWLSYNRLFSCSKIFSPWLILQNSHCDRCRTVGEKSVKIPNIASFEPSFVLWHMQRISSFVFLFVKMQFVWQRATLKDATTLESQNVLLILSLVFIWIVFSIACIFWFLIGNSWNPRLSEILACKNYTL